MSIAANNKTGKYQIFLKPRQYEDLRLVLKLLRKGINVNGRNVKVKASGISI